MLDYLRLFRLDVALIAFVSYLVGVMTVCPVTGRDWLVAGAISLVSTNFIYTINAWADREHDALDHPARPIPAGRISPRSALMYAILLFAGSIIYPPLVTRDALCLGLFYLMPALGVLYSVRPFHLRRFAVPSAALVSLGLVTPIQLGHYMYGGGSEMLPVFGFGFLLCLCIVPLKDITDVAGDTRAGFQNFYAWFGGRLPWICAGGLLLVAALLVVGGLPGPLYTFICAAAISVAAVILCSRHRPDAVYKRAIWTIVCEGILFLIVLRLNVASL